ncbi:hypothetical protein AQUCO_01700425v1 [Aquilegia coerulea]|uniref:Uncharacterized GPI-anchored protein At5g19230-like domain-containing protein n=1 Tax=Aquilegia coerulea TaxID=218851 RepID=A0A2G5DMT0_AQUCA|nr:hypothetical protein AQUCO_01700425v1 [Aquilegia coerulea]
MASLRLHLLLIMLVQALLMFSSPVTCDDEEERLLQRINSYRLSLRLSALAENDNADCLADEIADQLEDRPCPTTINSSTPEAQFSNYPKPLEHCHLSMNNTRDGAILLSCIPGQPKSLTVFNFTDPQYTRYLNKSKFIGAGIGSEDEWIVVVLTTNTPGGSFVASSAGNLVFKFGLIYNFLALILELLVLFGGVYI